MALFLCFLSRGQEAAELLVGKRHHNHFAAVRIIPEIVFFLNVDRGKCHGADSTIFINIYTGTFKFGPMVHAAVLIADKIFCRRVGTTRTEDPVQSVARDTWLISTLV